MAKDDYEAPPETETTLECPVCGSKLYLICYTTTIPYQGKIVINTYVCHHCLYKNASVFSEGDKSDKTITFHATEPEDMNVTLYRSPKAKITIPEIAAEILPGDSSEGTITTVEGILRTIEDRLDSFETDVESITSMNAVREFLSKIGSNEFKVTIVIQDESGTSQIHSAKAVVDRK